MSGIERNHQELFHAIGENNKHIRILQNSGEEIKRFEEQFINVADHVAAAVAAGQLVLPPAVQVQERLASGVTAEHARAVEFAFSNALFGTGTGVDAEVTGRLRAAKDHEANAENTLAVAAHRLDTALRHLQLAFNLLTPEDANTAPARLNNSKKSLGHAVHERLAANNAVTNYITGAGGPGETYDEQ